MDLEIERRFAGIENTLSRHNDQLGRLISDIESEKGTRSRVNADLEERLRRIERLMWIGIGAVLAVQITWGGVVIAVLNSILRKL